MKAISTGNIYNIYDDDLKTYDQLPAQSYSVRFSKDTGFYLEKHADIEIKEDKIYGVHEEKISKVLRGFEAFNRNLGVILSGDKGIGKSLFAKLLSVRAIENGYPLIIVDKFIPGISAFLESIEQEIVVLFDEFDKTFGNLKMSENTADAQASMLSLFDGIAQGKKLFVVTCNELRGLNDYLINRPGRFHYHFRFEYPSASEIKEYLQDKLAEQYWGEIDKVIVFSRKIDLNYDCLRAIAFELNAGEPFETAIKDLNILNMSTERYNIALHMENGVTLTRNNVDIDFFGANETKDIWLNDETESGGVRIKFNPKDCVFDVGRGINILQPEHIKLVWDEDYKEETKAYRNLAVECATIVRRKAKMLHYAV